MRYTEREIDDIATDIAVTRGTQERRDAIKKLIADLQTEPAKVFSSNTVLEDSSFCVVCGTKYKNPNKDSDTCYDCREPHAK